MSKKWNFLKAGDSIHIIAPASHPPKDKWEGAQAWISSLGLKPEFNSDIINPSHFFASPLEQQWSELKAALQSESKVIWCLRGGYGSMRLLPFLEKIKPPKEPKLLVGFSDITSLHLYFTQKWNWPTLHGLVLSQVSSPEHDFDRAELFQILTGDKQTLSFDELIPLNRAAEKRGKIEGTITGGNLTMIQSSLKTPGEIKAKGKILYLEDIGERGYSVDRKLEQLFQAKLIDKGVKALVLGTFTEGEEKDGKDLTDVAIKRFAERVNYPVLSGLPCGHGPNNRSLLFNTPAQLTTGKKSILSFESGGKFSKF